MTIINLTPPNEEFEVEKPVQGPFILRGFAGHRWKFSGGTECLDGQASLTCVDPCSIPYDYHSRRLCACAWAGDGDSLDFTIEDIEVTAKHVGYASPTYYDPDGEPGWIELEPVDVWQQVLDILDEERRASKTDYWRLIDRLRQRIEEARTCSTT